MFQALAEFVCPTDSQVEVKLSLDSHQTTGFPTVISISPRGRLWSMSPGTFSVKYAFESIIHPKLSFPRC